MCNALVASGNRKDTLQPTPKRAHLTVIESLAFVITNRNLIVVSSEFDI